MTETKISKTKRTKLYFYREKKKFIENKLPHLRQHTPRGTAHATQRAVARGHRVTF
jgi:hypothetical protein